MLMYNNGKIVNISVSGHGDSENHAVICDPECDAVYYVTPLDGISLGRGYTGIAISPSDSLVSEFNDVFESVSCPEVSQETLYINGSDHSWLEMYESRTRLCLWFYELVDISKSRIWDNVIASDLNVQIISTTERKYLIHKNGESQIVSY
jgi:hypothetical protein